MDNEKLNDIKFYSLKEISEATSLSVKTLQRNIQSGKLKAVKIGRVYRVSAEAVKDFMNNKQS